MDLDGDGHRDILSGSYSRMEQDMAGLFQVLYGKADGTFRKAEVLKGTDGEPLIIPIKGDEQMTENICTRPFAVDWDGDGHLDLVVGNFPGTFYLFKGQGKGKFLPKPEEIKAGDPPLKIEGHHSDPFVIDWDGDGDLDLLSGSSDGGVQWAENRAGKGKPPELSPFRTLIEPGPPIEYGQILREADLKGPTHATRIWVDDVNSDGKLDILVGDSVTLISPAQGPQRGGVQEEVRRLAEGLQGCGGGAGLGRRRCEGPGEGERRVQQGLRPARRVHARGNDRLRVVIPAEMTTRAPRPVCGVRLLIGFQIVVECRRSVAPGGVMVRSLTGVGFGAQRRGHGPRQRPSGAKADVRLARGVAHPSPRPGLRSPGGGGMGPLGRDDAKVDRRGRRPASEPGGDAEVAGHPLGVTGRPLPRSISSW